VRWPHIQTLTEQEKADGATKWASVNATAKMTVFTAEEIRDKWYNMAPADESDTESYKTDGATAWALTNKTQGTTIFTPDEIRKTWYGYQPLTPEQQVPIAAPERISGTTVDEPRAAQEDELLHVLETAITANNVDVIDKILGVHHQTQTASRVPDLRDVEAPTVILNPPAARRVKKTFTYSEIEGRMRPTGVVEEEL